MQSGAAVALMPLLIFFVCCVHRHRQTERPRYSVCSNKPQLVIAIMRPNNNKWLTNFDERGHRRLVTTCGGEWICVTLTPCNMVTLTAIYMVLSRAHMSKPPPPNGSSNDLAFFSALQQTLPILFNRADNHQQMLLPFG